MAHSLGDIVNPGGSHGGLDQYSSVLGTCDIPVASVKQDAWIQWGQVTAFKVCL